MESLDLESLCRNAGFFRGNILRETIDRELEELNNRMVELNFEISELQSNPQATTADRLNMQRLQEELRITVEQFNQYQNLQQNIISDLIEKTRNRNKIKNKVSAHIITNLTEQAEIITKNGNNQAKQDVRMLNDKAEELRYEKFQLVNEITQLVGEINTKRARISHLKRRFIPEKIQRAKESSLFIQYQEQLNLVKQHERSIHILQNEITQKGELSQQLINELQRVKGEQERLQTELEESKYQQRREIAEKASLALMYRGRNQENQRRRRKAEEISNVNFAQLQSTSKQLTLTMKLLEEEKQKNKKQHKQIEIMKLKYIKYIAENRPVSTTKIGRKIEDEESRYSALTAQLLAQQQKYSELLSNYQATINQLQNMININKHLLSLNQNDEQQLRDLQVQQMELQNVENAINAKKQSSQIEEQKVDDPDPEIYQGGRFIEAIENDDTSEEVEDPIPEESNINRSPV
jgi:hypothetical protein